MYTHRTEGGWNRIDLIRYPLRRIAAGTPDTVDLPSFRKFFITTSLTVSFSFLPFIYLSLSFSLSLCTCHPLHHCHFLEVLPSTNARLSIHLFEKKKTNIFKYKNRYFFIRPAADIQAKQKPSKNRRTN